MQRRGEEDISQSKATHDGAAPALNWKVIAGVGESRPWFARPPQTAEKERACLLSRYSIRRGSPGQGYRLVQGVRQGRELPWGMESSA